MLFYRRVTRHHGVFLTFSPRHRLFASHVIIFQTRHKKLSRYKFSAVKTCFNAYTRSQPAPTPPSPAVIFYPSCWSAGGQIHPSPRSGHPTPLIAAFLTPPHPAVILYPPSVSQINPSPAGGHPAPLLMVNFTPLHPAVIPQPSPPRGHPLPLPTRQSSSSGKLHFSSRLLVFQGEMGREGDGRRETREE